MFIKVASCLTTPLCYVMYQRITLFIATSSPPKFSQIKKVFLLFADNIMMNLRSPHLSPHPLRSPLSSYDWQVLCPVLSSTQDGFHFPSVKCWTANPTLYLEYFQMVSWLFMNLKRLTAYYDQVDHPETHRSILSWLMIV